MRMRNGLAAAAMVLAAGMTIGCRVDEHKNGDDKNVDISTPFGGMSVKTNGADVTAETGIDVYPGAQIVKKDKADKNDGDSGAADVNLSFGKFTLRVKAVEYQTQDAPAKVLAFYKKDMTKFGTVIECQSDHAVGKPDVTQDGLTCEHTKNNQVHVDEESDGKLELKTGSKLHQHLLTIKSEDGVTKIGMVALDLPGHLGIEDSDKDDDPHKQ